MSEGNPNQKRNKRFVVRVIVVILAIVLAVGLFPPLTDAQAEKEIASSLLTFIIQREIGGTADYIRTSGQPWVADPPSANIIIWAPFQLDEYYEPGLNTTMPLQVWRYEDRQLVERRDKRQSIEEYHQRYIEASDADIWGWGYYEFGIEKLSTTRVFASVYVGVSCGSVCGHGYRYILIRGPFGKWWIIRGEHLWQA